MGKIEMKSILAIAGLASWYGYECAEKPMANGKPFNPSAMTAAAWNFPLGTKVTVMNVANRKTVIVEITDRGPARRLGRLIDLSKAAFSAIADPDKGLIEVVVTQYEPKSDPKHRATGESGAGGRAEIGAGRGSNAKKTRPRVRGVGQAGGRVSEPDEICARCRQQGAERDS